MIYERGECGGGGFLDFAGSDGLWRPQVVKSGWITVFPRLKAHLYRKGTRLVNNAMSWEKRTVPGPYKNT